MFIPRKEKILKILLRNSPPKKNKITFSTSFSLFIKVLAEILSSNIQIKIIKLPPNLPSIPQILVFISFENIVENRKDKTSKKNPPSIVLFSILVFPSHMSLTSSKPNMNVEKRSINRDIPLSVQSQGKGIMDIGRMKKRIKKRYF
jgi:hypothetical protein